MSRQDKKGKIVLVNPDLSGSSSGGLEAKRNAKRKMKFENMVTGFDSVLNSQIDNRKTGYEDINEEMGDYLDDLSKFTPS